MEFPSLAPGLSQGILPSPLLLIWKEGWVIYRWALDYLAHSICFWNILILNALFLWKLFLFWIIVFTDILLFHNSDCLVMLISINYKLVLFSCSFNWFSLFRDSILICSPGWPTTHFVTQADSKLKTILLLLPPISWNYKQLPPLSMVNFLNDKKQYENHDLLQSQMVPKSVR